MTEFEKLGAFYLGKERVLETGEPAEDLLLYDSRDLTTHGVIVGMTGSGKTGLAISLLEEAAIDGVPAIAIDPKGDLGNLMLTFPELRPEDFLPWIDEGEAQRKGVTVDELASQTAETWKKGLADWDQDAERIGRFRSAVDMAIYTPGSSAGISISVLKSLSAPPQAILGDRDAMRERVSTTVSGLLSMLNIDADPVQSRPHILLSNILDRAWSEGRALDLENLIREIQAPPFDRVGVMDLETFFPTKERVDLAMSLNNLLASPGFASWMEGEPLDVQRLLWTAEGKPRLSIISIAHLSDTERQFFVTLLLNEVITWMRGQSGTSSLRAILYMDEIFGFFPPVANPPSKQPMLTLFKQARAYGLGVVVATQNPVDLDYKGLANAGTWFLGRLQTERDKARVLEGLQGASADAGKAFDSAKFDELLARLGNRVFLMNNVHDDVPVLFQTRWALSYLRGPLTRTQIQKLMADRRTAPASTPAPSTDAVAAAPAPVPAPAQVETPRRPILSPEIPETFVSVRSTAAEGESLQYRPSILGSAMLHFIDAKAGLDAWEVSTTLTSVPTDDAAPEWDSGSPVDLEQLALTDTPNANASFDSLPSSATRARSYKSWTTAFKDSRFRLGSLTLQRNAAADLISAYGESEGDFNTRVQQALRERRDTALDRIREQFAPRMRQLTDREQRAQERVARETHQYEQQKFQAIVSVGTSMLNAIFGGRRRASTAAVNRAGRAWSERGDIAEANESVEAVQQQRAELEAELERDLEQARVEFAPEYVALEPQVFRPRKSDISVEKLCLAWTPYWVDPNGGSRPAYS